MTALGIRQEKKSGPSLQGFDRFDEKGLAEWGEIPSYLQRLYFFEAFDKESKSAIPLTKLKFIPCHGLA